jgi:hypothetical protein
VAGPGAASVRVSVDPLQTCTTRWSGVPPRTRFACSLGETLNIADRPAPGPHPLFGLAQRSTRTPSAPHSGLLKDCKVALCSGGHQRAQTMTLYYFVWLRPCDRASGAADLGRPPRIPARASVETSVAPIGRDSVKVEHTKAMRSQGIPAGGERRPPDLLKIAASDEERIPWTPYSSLDALEVERASWLGCTRRAVFSLCARIPFVL